MYTNFIYQNDQSRFSSYFMKTVNLDQIS